jgi:hypothetical protein
LTTQAICMVGPKSGFLIVSSRGARSAGRDRMAAFWARAPAKGNPA